MHPPCRISLSIDCRGQNLGDTDDEEGSAPPRSKKKSKVSNISDANVEGLSAKQRRKVVSKATISDTDSSDNDGAAAGTQDITSAAR